MTSKQWIIVAAIVVVLLLAGTRTVFAVKPGAILGNRPEMEYARRIVAGVWQKHGYQLTVTSGYDSTEHMQNSLHYQGLAEDYRTRDVAPSDLDAMISEVRARLGSNYDVIKEVDHLHVEFDPK